MLKAINVTSVTSPTKQINVELLFSFMKHQLIIVRVKQKKKKTYNIYIVKFVVFLALL